LNFISILDETSFINDISGLKIHYSKTNKVKNLDMFYFRTINKDGDINPYNTWLQEAYLDSILV